jgi:hypothetical protein
MVIVPKIKGDKGGVMGYLLERLKAGRANFTTCKLSGDGFDAPENTITIRLLTSQDVLEATLAADRVFSEAEVPVSLQNIKDYEAEKDTQRLYRACADGDGKPLAANISEFRRLLTVAAKEKLIDRYNELEAECNPSLDTMTDAELDTLVEAVKKNPALLSKVSSIGTLRRLSRCLASLLAPSPTGSGHT